MKISNKWRKKAEIYKFFAVGVWNTSVSARSTTHNEPIRPCPYDFSEESAMELYLYESQGIGSIEIDTFATTQNGYAIGKKWCDWQVNFWKEQIATGLLYLNELYQDEELKNVHWWLDLIFKKQE